MTGETKVLVETIIKNDLNKIKNMEIGADERYNAIKDVDALMKMVTDAEKADIEREKIAVDREKLELEEKKMTSETEISNSKIEMEKQINEAKNISDQERLILDREIHELDKEKVKNEATAAKKRQRGENAKVATETVSRIAVAGLGFAGTCLAIYADRNGWFISKPGLQQNPKLNIK